MPIRPWTAARPAPRGHLAALAVVVLSAHALVVTARGPAAWNAPGDVDRVAVQIRMVTSAPSVHAQQSAATAAVPTGTSSDRPIGADRPSVQKPSATIETAAAAASTNQWVTGARDPFAEFLPRSALTVGPRPLQPVLIDFPEFVGAATRYAAEFEILVNDAGSVVHVVEVDPGLPQILLQAVREAFAPVQFTPGEVDGWPVRSRFRIEVTFDSQPRQS